MIDDIITQFQYTAPPVVACLVLIGLLGIITVGGFAWMLLKDVAGALFTLEGFAFVVMLLAIASVIYYAMYG